MAQRCGIDSVDKPLQRAATTRRKKQKIKGTKTDTEWKQAVTDFVAILKYGRTYWADATLWGHPYSFDILGTCAILCRCKVLVCKGGGGGGGGGASYWGHAAYWADVACSRDC